MQKLTVSDTYIDSWIGLSGSVQRCLVADVGDVSTAHARRGSGQIIQE